MYNYLVIRKKKLVYSNGLIQVHLSSPFSDGGSRTAHKTCLKLSINYQETQNKKARQSRYRSKNCRTVIAKVQ